MGSTTGGIHPRATAAITRAPAAAAVSFRGCP